MFLPETVKPKMAGSRTNRFSGGRDGLLGEEPQRADLYPDGLIMFGCVFLKPNPRPTYGWSLVA